MARAIVLATFSVMLLLAAACSGGSESEQEDQRSDSFREIASPLVDIVPAASIGEDGQPVDPALVFAPDDPQITVVARAGDVAGSPMDITWSHLTQDGETELFAHTVEVASFDTAYSVGENPGTLAPGRYRVEATLEEQSLATEFEVTAAPETGAAGQAAASAPPASGDSGVVGPPLPPGGVSSPEQTRLDTILSHAPVDPNARTIVLTILATVRGGGGRVVAKATMAGSTRTRSFPTDESGVVARSLDFDPCAQPGGSDLPGTEAQFETTLFEGEREVETLVDPTRLGPDTARPAVTLNAEPRSGSKVEAGDEIVFDVTAQEARSRLSWQTGVRELRVKAIPGEDLVPQVRADSGSAQPCDRKQWSLATQGSYEVPENPPATFRICPIAIDFAGNQNADTCATYSTGEVWEGSYAGTVTYDCPGRPRATVEGEFTITVDDNGAATMDITHTITGSCLGPNVGTRTDHVTVTGERTPNGFEFPSFTGGSGSFTIAASGDRGSGTLIEPGRPGIVRIEIRFEITRS